MRAAARGLALALAFALELAVYGSVAAWGLGLAVPVLLRIAVAVAGVGVLAVAWGRYAAPRARHPLSGPARVVLEVAWFGLGAAALAATGHVLPALVGVGLYVVQAATLRLVPSGTGGPVPLAR